MNNEISLLEMFLQAGPVVRSVILCLLAASIWCWAIILDAMWSLWQLGRAVRSRGTIGGATGAALAQLLKSGLDRVSGGGDLPDPNAKRHLAVAEMKRRAQEVIERLQAGLPNLAVIASVAPFVGLFGIVWGIMMSFAGIAQAKDTSLAVVAPGIAEALAATAIGLAAAIPASFAYNRLAASFNRKARALNRLIEDIADQVNCEDKPPQAVIGMLT